MPFRVLYDRSRCVAAHAPNTLILWLNICVAGATAAIPTKSLCYALRIFAGLGAFLVDCQDQCAELDGGLYDGDGIARTDGRARTASVAFVGSNNRAHSRL